MLVLNDEFMLAVERSDSYQLFPCIILTSSDIKAEARKDDLPFKVVADSYIHLGIDDNGNNYYVKPIKKENE